MNSKNRTNRLFWAVVVGVLLTSSVIFAQENTTQRGTVFLPLVSSQSNPSSSKVNGEPQIVPQPPPTPTSDALDFPEITLANDLPRQPIDFDKLPECPESKDIDYTNLPPPDYQSTDGCRVKSIQMDMQESSPIPEVSFKNDSEGIMAIPAMPYTGPILNDRNELVVPIEPCVTPTSPANYRELISPGSMICIRSACVKGPDLPNQPLPTPYFGQPPFLEPISVTIVYTSYTPCNR